MRLKVQVAKINIFKACVNRAKTPYLNDSNVKAILKHPVGWSGAEKKR